MCHRAPLSLITRDGFGSADAVELDRCKCGTNLFLFISRELHGSRAEVFFQMAEFGGARNRHDPRLLREEPAERELCGRDALPLGPVANQVAEAACSPSTPRA